MNKTCIFIFTHFFTKFLLGRIFDINNVIKKYNNIDLYIIYNLNDNNEISDEALKLLSTNNIELYTYTDKYVIEEMSKYGYTVKSSWFIKEKTYTWNNIMSPIMAFYLSHNNYDYYWYIESDAIYKGDFTKFLDFYNDKTEDYIYCYNTKNIPKDSHIKAFDLSGITKTTKKYTTFNPIFRLSNKLFRYLHEIYSKGYSGYIEGFLPTLVMNNPNMSYRNLLNDNFLTIDTVKYVESKLPSFSYRYVKKENIFYHPMKK